MLLDATHPRWRARPDAAEKARGAGGYLTDLSAPGMVHARILRAGVPHARIVSIDTSAAEALHGVVAVVTHRDVPGLNAYGIVIQDQPALCADRVRYPGDAVAAVAAETPEIAAQALGLIRVTYAPLPVIDDMEAALAPGAIPLHGESNLLHTTEFVSGDADAAFAGAARIVRATYETPRQMHGFLETEGGIVIPEPDGRLTVKIAGQHGRRDRLQLARILGWPEERIRVISTPSGGAFGGKDELTVQPAACLLAVKCGRPVRLRLSREESAIAGWKRHPMRITMETAADAGGRLAAHRVRIVADTGAYASLGPAVLLTATENAVGPYVIPNVDLGGRLAYTNNAVAGAFRGFGANQATFALECQMDRLADALGLDRLEFRRRNLRDKADRGAFGQTVVTCDGARDVAAALAGSRLWADRGAARDRRDPSGRYRWGTGLALSMQGNGLGSLLDDPGGGRLTLRGDGRIEAAFSLEEFGQNAVGAIVEAGAAILGVAPEDMAYQLADTDLAPDTGSSTASRGLVITVQALQRMREPFTRAVIEAAAAVLGDPAATLALGPGGIHRSGANAPALTFAALAAAHGPIGVDCEPFQFPKGHDATVNCRFVFAFAGAVARVRVDTWTGAVKVEALDHACAAGPVVSPLGYLTQIEGAAVQALGFALTEDTVCAGAHVTTPNFDRYLMPTIADAPPDMAVHALETLEPDDPVGPRGVGEMGVAAAAPAIVNAIADATGVRTLTLPVTPARLLAALETAR